MPSKPISTLVIGIGGSGAWTAVHVKKQLMDMYHNEMPDNVGVAVIDTAKKPLAKLPPIELEPFEYAHIGGSSYDLVKKIRDTDEYPHLKSWFLADDYLRTLGQDLFNLDQGAGQFRQFGRLALFRDVIAPAQSSIAAIVDRRLNAIARKTNANSPSILVMVVGSLTGGTGAGLFLDIPHLIRRVAMASRVNIVLRAFMFLPDAFASTLPRNELTYAEPRAFAAMRELNRFLLNEDYEYGYPIYYHGENSGSDSTIWRAKTEGPLYDFVFLIDGQGTQRINTRKFEDGAAAVVADAIMTYTDPQYGSVQAQANANIAAKQSLQQQRTGRRAYVSALGAYSIMMPIQQIVKGWAYELGREIVFDLVPPAPEKLDEQGHIRSLSMTSNLERSESSPQQETERLMTTNPEVTDPNDADGGRRIAPTPMWRFLYQLDQERRNQNPEKLVRHLESYDLESWLKQLTPPPLSTDQRTRQVLGETKAILEDQVADRIETSDQRKPAGNPADDYSDIAKRAEQYIDLQLGRSNSDGTRQGGQYNDALRRFSDYQLDRFRNYLAAYVMGTLNGVDARDRTAAKIGKLGWLMAVLRDMRDVFASTHELLEAVRQGTAGQSLNRRRAEVQTARDDALENMRVTAGKPNRFLGKHPGIEGQITFLRAVQEYVDFHRTQFARDSISLTARRVRDFLDSTLRELETWAEVLATGTHSLYTELVDGGRVVKSERLKAQTVVNHRVITDDEWERERFERYKEDGRAREKLFEAWQWKTNLSTDTRGDTVLDITVTLRGETHRKDQRGEAAKTNLQIILDFCQNFFYSAIEKENIMQYLMEREFLDNPRGLANELTEKAGYLLDMPMNTATAGLIPRNVLLTKYDRTRPEQAQFVREVVNSIAAQHGQGTTSDDTSTLFQTVEGDDPFRVTLLSTADVIPLQDIQAYLRYREGYLKLPWDARQQTHVFPAEVHAVRYEEQLTRLKQSRRILSHRVGLLLEDEQTFLEFLLLLTHKIVVKRKDEANRQRTEFLWLLEAPSERREDHGRMKNWYLTTSGDDPALLEAAITYCVLGDDVRSRRDKGYTQPIPYDHLLKYLEQAQKEDAAKRIERDALAIIPDPDGEGYIFDEELRVMIEAFMPPLDENEEPNYDEWSKEEENEFLDIATQVVRHDMLVDTSQYLESQLPDLKTKLDAAAEGQRQEGERHTIIAERQELYDFNTVAVLALQNEMQKLRNVIEDRYEAKTERRGRGLGGSRS